MVIYSTDIGIVGLVGKVVDVFTIDVSRPTIGGSIIVVGIVRAALARKEVVIGQAAQRYISGHNGLP